MEELTTSCIYLFTTTYIDYIYLNVKHLASISTSVTYVLSVHFFSVFSSLKSVDCLPEYIWQ